MFQAKLDAGEDVPFLRDMPTPIPQYDWIREAFNVLASMRFHGHDNNPQPIQMSEILAYAVMHGIEDPDDREDLVSGLMAMDEAALKYIREQMNAERKKQQRASQSKSKGGRRGAGRR